MVRGIIGVLGVALVLLPLLVGAQQTRYVSDELRIEMRSGPGNQFRILDYLTSGTRLTAREQTEDWTRIELPGGRDGWVLTRFLSESPSARSQLAQVQQNTAALRVQNEQLTASLEEFRQRVSMLETALTEVSSERDALSQQVEQAEQGLRLHDENQEMRKRVIDLQREIQDLTHEIDRLQDRNDQRWFLVGGFVLFFGLLLGLILPRLGWRRRSSWSSGSL